MNPKQQSGDGVLRFVCPCCGYCFRYKRGRKRNPKVKEVYAWLLKVQCRNCGVLINAYNRNMMSAQKDRVRKQIDLSPTQKSQETLKTNDSKVS